VVVCRIINDFVAVRWWCFEYPDSSKKRCGFKALANAFIGEDDGDDVPEKATGSFEKKTIHLGLRRTLCDTAGADALAAMLVAAKDDMGGSSEIELELALNPVIEDETIAALHGEDEYRLRDMAERYMEAMEVIRRAQQRAAEAARMMAARREAETAFDQKWDAPPESFGAEGADDEDEPYEEEWDSDADYENEEEDDDYK